VHSLFSSRGGASDIYIYEVGTKYFHKDVGYVASIVLLMLCPTSSKMLKRLTVQNFILNKKHSAISF